MYPVSIPKPSQGAPLHAPALTPCTDLLGVWTESVLCLDICEDSSTKPAQSPQPQKHEPRNLLGSLEAGVAAGCGSCPAPPRAGWEVRTESPRGCRAGGAPCLGPPGGGCLGGCQEQLMPCRVPAQDTSSASRLLPSKARGRSVWLQTVPPGPSSHGPIPSSFPGPLPVQALTQPPLGARSVPHGRSLSR